METSNYNQKGDHTTAYNDFDLERFLRENYPKNAYEIEPFISFDNLDKDSSQRIFYYGRLVSRGQIVVAFDKDRLINLSPKDGYLPQFPIFFYSAKMDGSEAIYFIGYRITFKRQVPL